MRFKINKIEDKTGVEVIAMDTFTHKGKTEEAIASCHYYHEEGITDAIEEELTQALNKAVRDFKNK